MSRSQKEIKFFASNQKAPNSLYRPIIFTRETSEAKKTSLVTQSLSKNSLSSLLSSTPQSSSINQTPKSSSSSTPIAQTPKSTFSKPVSPMLSSSQSSTPHLNRQSFTPKPSKDSHPIPYVFHSKSNTLSSKNFSRIQKNQPIIKKNEKSEKIDARKNNELNDVVTQVKSISVAEKNEGNQADMKQKSEKIYKEHLFQTFHALKFVKTLPVMEASQLKQKRLKLGKRPGYESKKTIIFDLDETLVHCVNDPSLPYQATIEIKFPSGEKTSANINIRPFAKECLAAANKLFEVIVFTASHQCYADAVLDFIDPTRELVHHRLYRENCIVIEGVHIKDLRVFVNRDIKDIVIVDNAAYSFGYHLDNGIPIISWYDDVNDKELFNLIEYIKVLAKANDIRDVNKEVFHLKNFCESYSDDFLKNDKKVYKNKV